MRPYSPDLWCSLRRPTAGSCMIPSARPSSLIARTRRYRSFAMLEGLFLNNLSRRGFLQRALAGLTVGAGLPAWFAQELVAAEEEKRAREKKTVAANDRLVLGVIGGGHPNSRGTQIMALAKGHKGVEVAAVCDVDARHRDRAAHLAGGRDVEKF